jgi:DNA polymerase-3 subunit epsilon
VLADALGIEVREAHRALADAETCARVLCALLPRLCANASTVADALKALTPRRRARRLSARASSGHFPAGARSGAAGGSEAPSFAELPRDPGVYLFRDDAGRVLYVGKSISIRSRARAHFAPSAAPAAWTQHATVVDYRTTCSELGALVLENRLIKQLAPPGNKRLTLRDDRLVYVVCRLDIPYPILEVAAKPAAGHAVSVGPLRGRRLAAELVEQLDSLFALRHCGRRLARREYPSAYGQMGRCLSPCLGDLDPNLYRRRLDEVLRLFVTESASDAPGQPLLDHVERQMNAAAAEQRFERAAALRRRRRRLGVVLERLGGLMEATHARPRLLVAPHPNGEKFDCFWIAGGRLVDWGPLGDDRDELDARTAAAVARSGRLGELGAHVPPDEIDELRILGGWLAAHPDAAQLALRPAPDADVLHEFVSRSSAIERKFDHERADLVGADDHV